MATTHRGLEAKNGELGRGTEHINQQEVGAADNLRRIFHGERDRRRTHRVREISEPRLVIIPGATEAETSVCRRRPAPTPTKSIFSPRSQRKSDGHRGY